MVEVAARINREDNIQHNKKMSIQYRTLSLKMSCSGRKKKRLKNLDNLSCLCHANDIRYIPNYNARDGDEFVSNNNCSEIMSSKRGDRSTSLDEEKSSEHVLTCKKYKSVSATPAVKVKTSFYSSNAAIFMISLIIILLKHVEVINAFNIDTVTRVVFSQPPSTMFGFSVAGHKEGNVGW